MGRKPKQDGGWAQNQGNKAATGHKTKDRLHDRVHSQSKSTRHKTKARQMGLKPNQDGWAQNQSKTSQLRQMSTKPKQDGWAAQILIRENGQKKQSKANGHTKPKRSNWAQAKRKVN